MEFIKEEKAFRHYNAAGEMDAEITYIPEGEGVIDANHTFVDQAYADKELHVNQWTNQQTLQEMKT